MAIPHIRKERDILDNYILQPLTDFERKFAEENHNLIYRFLNRYGYSLEDFYDIAVFGYLKAVQLYNRREDLRNKYDFPFISWQYMRAELGNYFRMENAKKRRPAEGSVSLNAMDSELENLYNYMDTVGGNPIESEILDKERLMEVLDSLSDTQRKIAELKADGFSSKEIYSALEMKPSTYYVEVQRIRKTLEKMAG